MKVDPGKPFKIVYSLYNHQCLGYLFESYAVQLDDQGRVTLQYQNISNKNAHEFDAGMDDADRNLVEWIDEIHPDAVVRKFAQRKMAASEFFFKIYDPSKGNEDVQKAIEEYLQRMKSRMMPLLIDKPVFETSGDGEPTWRQLAVPAQPATITFRFKRHEKETHYWPQVHKDGVFTKIVNQNALLIAEDPAWLLLNREIIHFKPEVQGSKIKPFLTKDHIIIPRNIEDKYFRKFVVPLIEDYQVKAEGLSIITDRPPLKARLMMSEYANEAAQLSLIGESGTEADDAGQRMRMELRFYYGEFEFSAERVATGDKKDVSVFLKKDADNYIFHKIKRDRKAEQAIINQLASSGLQLANGKSVMDRDVALVWASHFSNTDLAEQLHIEQRHTNGVRYFIGKSSINVEVTENKDWFDINARIQFGPYQIPFMQIRNLMLQMKRQFALPNGEIAVIPEEWFAQLADLWTFSQEDKEKRSITLHKMHLAVLEDLSQTDLATVNMTQRLQTLRTFEGIDDFQLPSQFVGQLRPYQKAGYDWMLFLNSYRLGGCLADDMGLGKTVQTLSLLQYQKEHGPKVASLLVVPTSLIYNWELEARKFVPDLRILNHTGTQRQRQVEQFAHYDLVLTSYGTLRADIDLLEKYHFNYIILDESQAIKNPGSAISKAVLRLHSLSRLILTGTPLENSTMDLWSQMNFVNPGLLGSQTFFRNSFLTRIEKRQDEGALQKLQRLIKPFILRRTKDQVATELPPKTELVQYCEMDDEQNRRYEEAKSRYRNQILAVIEEQGMAKSQLFVLQGLTYLRQLANHPAMVEADYTGASGKMDDVLYKLESVLQPKDAHVAGKQHKVLIFSQFVKHLTLLRAELDKRQIRYAYLDGSTRDRQAEVEQFQTNPDVPVFLLSLKAGGTGLNLTAADYVFLLDPWWNPAVEAQAVDRAHRIGQDKRVIVYKFITRHSVEEKILALQQSKRALASGLITTEDGFMKNLSQSDIEALLT